MTGILATALLVASAGLVNLAVPQNVAAASITTLNLKASVQWSETFHRADGYSGAQTTPDLNLGSANWTLGTLVFAGLQLDHATGLMVVTGQTTAETKWNGLQNGDNGTASLGSVGPFDGHGAMGLNLVQVNGGSVVVAPGLCQDGTRAPIQAGSALVSLIPWKFTVIGLGVAIAYDKITNVLFPGSMQCLSFNQIQLATHVDGVGAMYVSPTTVTTFVVTTQCAVPWTWDYDHRICNSPDNQEEVYTDWYTFTIDNMLAPAPMPTPTPTPTPVPPNPPVVGSFLGDFTGDGSADVVARDSAGYLRMLPHTPSSGWGTASLIGSGWNGMTAIVTADFNADGNADVISRDSAGYLWLYPHSPSGFGARSQIGNGWNGMTAILAADFNGDGYPDIICRDSAGYLWLYPHSPSGFGARSQIGNGWNGMTAIVAADFTGDGSADIIARDGAGNLWLYPHTPSGFRAQSLIGSGWNGFSNLYAADYTGDGQADMVACDSAGNLWLYPHTPSGWGTSSRIYPGWSGCTALL
jgi:hypothetical protein